jgi:hypothetical protein
LSKNERAVFLVDLITRQGRVFERYETYAEARRRVEQFPADSLVGLAFIFEELPDGSERLVREDGKPIQFHRRPEEEMKESSDEPLSLAEDSSGLLGPDGKLRIVEPQPPGEEWEDL